MEMNHSGYVLKDKDVPRTFKCKIEGQKILKDGEKRKFLREN